MEKTRGIKLTESVINSRLPPYLTIDFPTFKKSTYKARFIDSEYGEFWIVPYAVFRGQNHPKRGKKNAISKKKLSIDSIKSRLPEHLKIIDNTYVNASSKCMFIDSIYGQFEARPTVILQGKSEHPNRAKDGYVSPRTTLYIDNIPLKQWCAEHELPYSSAKALMHLGEDYIKTWKNNYNTARSTLEVFVSSKLSITPYNKYPCYDLKYKPDFKLADGIYLNADGLYWHCSENREKDYHLNMREAFSKKGFRLFQFTSDQILKKWHIVSSIIGNSRGEIGAKIYARKCTVESIPYRVASQFLEMNHIMGTSKNKALGLVHQGKLVSTMTYSVRSGGVIKIERFATKTGCVAVGALSKLLKEIQRLNPEAKFIQSWVDLRYGTGDSLLKCGFTHVKTTLGWKWTDGHRTFNRLKCRANMDERKLTEKQHAEELGWYKIYDAGQALFTKEI
jgi:hypothetical protein